MSLGKGVGVFKLFGLGCCKLLHSCKLLLKRRHRGRCCEIEVEVEKQGSDNAVVVTEERRRKAREGVENTYSLVDNVEEKQNDSLLCAFRPCT